VPRLLAGRDTLDGLLQGLDRVGRQWLGQIDARHLAHEHRLQLAHADAQRAHFNR
jgi:hypothetical protein